MATVIGSHVSDYVLGRDDSKAGDIARAMYEKRVSLVQVIESLGEFLLNQNVDLRKRGTCLLAEVLPKLPQDFLTEKEVAHVTTFLLSKLNEHHSIQPIAVHGLAAVTSFKAFSDAPTSRKVCSEIFKEVQNQSLNQRDRRAVYTIFFNLLTYHLADLVPMGDNFVCGYVQQMDGEKDPRNLVLAFHCSLIICQNFSLGAMEEDMFEVNSCYFPIDFVPPPNNIHGITRQDLREALCKVMAATPAFAKYCYPLLLEKLSSDITSAKLDAVETLCACLRVFETKDLQEHLGLLYSQLVKEVRAGSSEELVAASLQALAAVAAQVSVVPQQLGEFMADLGASLVRQVEGENSVMQLSATRILCAMATANADVCHAVVSRLVPAVCGVSQKISQLEQRTAFFTEVTSLLQQVSDMQIKRKDWSILQDWKGKLQNMCDRLLATKDHQLQILGMRGLCAMTTWSTVLSAEEISCSLQKMAAEALGADIDSFREESGMALTKAVSKYTHLSESLISHLEGMLQTNLSQYETWDGQNMVDNSASYLVNVAVDMVTGEKVCDVLKNALHAYRTGHEECMIPISKSLQRVLAIGHLSPVFVVKSAVPSILQFLWSVCVVWPDDKHLLHVSVLSNLVDGLRSAVLLLDAHFSLEMVSYICNILLNKNQDFKDSFDGFPWKAVTSWKRSRLIQVLLAAIPCLDVKDDSVMEPLLSGLPDIALGAQDDHTHEQACRCLAALINKIPRGSQLDTIVKELWAGLKSNIHQHSDAVLQKRTINLFTWLTKALVVNGNVLSVELTSQLTSLLSDRQIGPKAAEGFCVIMTPFPDVLCSGVRAVVTPTFQQRFLVQNLSHLLSSFKTSPQEVKENYLLAVVGMLTHVPQQVLMTELPQLMPVLASSLKGTSSNLQVQSLSTLMAGLKQSPELLTSYLSDILPDCLTLATSGTAMRTRILALQCVHEMVHLPAPSLQPHINYVIKSLKKPIDDPKRLVRKEAVLTRSAWYLL